jgi:DNA-binding NtrC family response regulator
MARGKEARMAGQKILLIEDSVDDAFLVKRILEKQLGDRLKVSHQKTMAGAESYMKENKEDLGLILLDLGLPDTKDGRESFERMKKYTSEIPVVVLTGMEDHELALSFVREGAADFVNKSMLHDKPELLGDIVEFSICRHQLMGDRQKKYEKKIEEKEQVISWMSGDYSIHK